jgi:hypothetical protein
MRSQTCEQRLLASSCPPSRPTARMEQLGSLWTDFDEIWYLNFFFEDMLRKFKFLLK